MYGGYFTTSGTFSFVVYQDIIINGLYTENIDVNFLDKQPARYYVREREERKRGVRMIIIAC